MIPTPNLLQQERHFILYVIQRFPSESAHLSRLGERALTSEELCGDGYGRVCVDCGHVARRRRKGRGKGKRREKEGMIT
jgi:hypothetical protein